MSVAERRQREKLALRQEILAAARQLFAKEGYEQVSMRRIAQKIEYSPTTIYLYFRDKDELIGELCEESFLLLKKKVETALGDGGDPVDNLKRGLRAYVDFGILHPNHYRTTFLTPHEDLSPEQMSSAGRAAFEMMLQGVGKCIKARRFCETDVNAIGQALWCMVHGLTALQITHRNCFPWIDRERLITMTIEKAVAGFLR